MAKDLKYFMRDNTPEIVTAPGPDSFKDDKGAPIQFEIKVLTQADIQRINDNYRKRSMATDKKGNPIVAMGEVVWKTEKDSNRAVRHIIAESLVYPNLKDPELMKFYNCADITEMPLLVFPRSDEFNHVSRIVLNALGMGNDVATDDDTVDAAKN